MIVIETIFGESREFEYEYELVFGHTNVFIWKTSIE